MKLFYLLLVGAVLLPGIIHAVSIRTTDNRVFNNVRLVKVTSKGLVFKYRHRRNEFVTLKPEELDYEARQDYAKQIKIYNNIHKSGRKQQDQIADRQQRYFNMQVGRWSDADPVKHLHLLVRLRKSFISESSKEAKHDFTIWRKKVNSIFPEYENALLKMTPVDAFDRFNRDRGDCRKLGVLESDFASLWKKMATAFVQKFPEELEKLKNLPLESRIPHAEKMLAVYKDLSVDLKKIKAVIEADKMDFSILKALKTVEAGNDHAAEIATLENLINSYPRHPKIPELKKLKGQHEYNLQVKKDLALFATLYPHFSKNPENVLRVLEKAVKAYSDSLYAQEVTTLLSDCNAKWKVEQEKQAVQQAAEEAKRRREEDIRQREYARKQMLAECEEKSQKLYRETGYWLCGHCLGTGYYRARRGGADFCPTCNTTGKTLVKWAFEKPNWYDINSF
ncbi:MAG: hypothetical protein IKC08_10275 [Lentisphaeria bacterium]|nr:hypothetical protein [Lentisphaeria bacterium]